MTQYKGFTIATPEEDGWYRWSLTDDKEDYAVASSYSNTSNDGTQYRTEGEAMRAAKAKVNQLIKIGY